MISSIFIFSAPIRTESAFGNSPVAFTTDNVWKGGSDPHDENIGLGHGDSVIIAGDILSSKALFRRLAPLCYDLDSASIVENCGKKEMFSTRKYSMDELEAVLVDTYSPTGHAFSTLIQALVYANKENEAKQDGESEFGSPAVTFYEEIEKFNIPYVMDAMSEFDGYYHPNTLAPTVIEAFRTALLSNLLREVGPMAIVFAGVPVSGIMRPTTLDLFR